MRYRLFILVLISFLFFSCSSCKIMNEEKDLFDDHTNKISFLTKVDQLPQGSVQIIIKIDENTNSNNNKFISGVINKVLKQGPNAPYVNVGDKIILNYSNIQDISKISDASKILVRKLHSNQNNLDNNWQLIAIE